MFPIVRTSFLLPVPDTVNVAVIVVGLLMATLAPVISAPAAKLMLGIEDVLNSNPAGAFNTKVTPDPAAKSPFAPSSILIGPKVVQAAVPPDTAVSAEMPAPPDAPVTVTLACAPRTKLKTTPSQNRIRIFTMRLAMKSTYVRVNAVGEKPR